MATTREWKDAAVGSRALGLAYVASGKIDALVQPTQRLWDNGIKTADSLGPNDYDPESKDFGFVAEVPWIVDDIVKLLV